jgi:hypothetical protein
MTKVVRLVNAIEENEPVRLVVMFLGWLGFFGSLFFGMLITPLWSGSGVRRLSGSKLSWRDGFYYGRMLMGSLMLASILLGSVLGH